MVYIVFNVLLSISMIFFTNQVNKKIKEQTITAVSLSVAMLFSIIASVVFSFLLILKEIGYAAFVGVSMKVVLASEGFALTTLSFALIEMGESVRHKATTIFKYIFLGIITYIVFFKINRVELSSNYGPRILSGFVFKGFFRHFVPVTWYQLYSFIVRFALPTIGFLFLILMQERHNVTQLEKYQTVIIGAAIVLMWAVFIAVKYVATSSLNIAYLYMFSYAYMYMVIYMGLSKTTVPSGRATIVSLFKVIVSYIIPALIVGYLVAYLQPFENDPQETFIFTFCIYGSIFMLVAVNSSYFLSSSTKLYTADYGAGLEKELAAIEYRETDMDVITAKMYEILKKHAETSSLNVYISSGKYDLETAYSSNGLNQKILLTNPIFDVLLNINKTVVVYSEIEKEHSLFTIQDGLKEFFEYTKSDALFILNEGHNIFGIITLGRKITGDHFKSYDYNVFEKLYSYFFVFGYYMRNISNRDIIGVVNREIRMSSQIITSIQENIDKVKSEKVDIGYLMVPAHNIGGEFIDLIRLTDTRHLFVVGDLSGKGIAASMNMVILKSIIRTHLAEIHDFKELIVRLNRFIRESLPKGTIFAGLFALIDFETDTMYYINCGIPALMLYTQVYNNVIEIQGSGHVLGFVKDISPYISVKTTKLNPGDILLACTDGLVQSHSLRGESFGKERIQHSILDNASYNAQRMTQFVFDSLVKFMSREMEDDVSILTIKYVGRPTDGNNENPVESDVIEDLEEVEENENEPMQEVQADAEVAQPEPVKEPLEETTVEQPVSAEPVQESTMAEMPDFSSSPMAGIDDPDLPDLSDLDDLLKEAGL